MVPCNSLDLNALSGVVCDHNAGMTGYNVGEDAG